MDLLEQCTGHGSGPLLFGVTPCPSSPPVSPATPTSSAAVRRSVRSRCALQRRRSSLPASTSAARSAMPCIFDPSRSCVALQAGISTSYHVRPRVWDVDVAPRLTLRAMIRSDGSKGLASTMSLHLQGRSAQGHGAQQLRSLAMRYFGIDVSRDRLDCAVVDERGERSARPRSFTNDPDGVRSLIIVGACPRASASPRQVVMEATAAISRARRHATSLFWCLCLRGECDQRCDHLPAVSAC